MWQWRRENGGLHPWKWGLVMPLVEEVFQFCDGRELVVAGAVWCIQECGRERVQCMQ